MRPATYPTRPRSRNAARPSGSPTTGSSPASCDPALAQTLAQIAGQASGFSAILNGRFTGGYITRHYGQPAQGLHAVQLEMTQCSYMQEALPFDYLPVVAARVQPHVRRMLEAVLDFVETRQG